MKHLENTSILLSVKSVYAELLVAGIKTIELRRRFPTDLEKGTTLFIYSSGGPKAVIGRCEVDSVKKLPVLELWKLSSPHAMISWDDFMEYFQGCEQGYAILVKKPLRFEKDIQLSKVSGNRITRPPQSYCYLKR